MLEDEGAIGLWPSYLFLGHGTFRPERYVLETEGVMIFHVVYDLVHHDPSDSVLGSGRS